VAFRLCIFRLDSAVRPESGSATGFLGSKAEGTDGHRESRGTLLSLEVVMLADMINQHLQ
jgi:hypothetical protein